MRRGGSTPPPSDEEIKQYDNVPVTLAARYIGWSAQTVYRALQEERAPFGIAVECEGNWAYNISPGLLVKYKRGELPTYRLREVEEIASDGIRRIIDSQMKLMRDKVDILKGVLLSGT